MTFDVCRLERIEQTVFRQVISLSVRRGLTRKIGEKWDDNLTDFLSPG